MPADLAIYLSAREQVQEEHPTMSTAAAASELQRLLQQPQDEALVRIFNVDVRSAPSAFFRSIASAVPWTLAPSTTGDATTTTTTLPTKQKGMPLQEAVRRLSAWIGAEGHELLTLDASASNITVVLVACADGWPSSLATYLPYSLDQEQQMNEKAASDTKAATNVAEATE